MSTSTILRVKRRLEENPQDALVLVCKRVKTDTEEISPSLFVFRGTVDNQEPILVKNIVPKDDLKQKSIPNVSDIIQKIRKERKDVSTENRYEVINFSRGLNENSNDNNEGLINLVDLVKVNDKEQDVGYIYDLYTSAKPDFDVSMLDNLLSIENYETDLIFGSYRDNGQLPSDGEADDEDDSNDENNWRNDYPDSDLSSIDKDDMVQAIAKCDLEDDLSSDTGEDKIYDEPPDLFNEDVKRYGAAYAKYKAKIVSEDPSLADSRSIVHCTRVKDLDEESIEGYKDDSDDGFYYGEEKDSEQLREQYGHDSSDEYSPD